MSFKITNKSTTFLTVCGQCLSIGESIVIDAVTYAEWQETIDHLKFRDVIAVEPDLKAEFTSTPVAEPPSTSESPELDS